MRILIASTHVPFIQGGGTRIVDDLAGCLRDAGHQIDVVSLPVWETWQELPAQMLAMRLFDLAVWCDRLITVRTPSHLLEHPDKHVWFLHHHRGAYDLWGTPYQDLPDSDEGRRVRAMIHAADAQGLREAKRIYAISPTSRDRLHDFSGVDSRIVYPPLAEAERYRCEPAERYVLCHGRITAVKRQVLAVEAMAHVSSDVKLIIVGPPDSMEALDQLEGAIEKNGVADRVAVDARWISEEEKRDLLARCLGSLLIPFHEEYGYVGLEACHSAKPLITCSDSGGILDFVIDGETGYVVPPDAEQIGAAIDRLGADPRRAVEMGRAAEERPAALGISWRRVVEAFTA